MPSYVDSYLHGNKIGVVVMFICQDEFAFRTGEFKTLSRHIGMQIAASCPKAIDYQLLDTNFIENKLSFTRKRIADLSPDERRTEIDKATRNLKEEYCLLNQPLITNPKITVAEEINRISQELDVEISIAEFKRIETSSD